MRFKIGKVLHWNLTFYCEYKTEAKTVIMNMGRDMTKPTKWVCAQRRLRSAWTSAQSDQSLLCVQCVAKDPRFLRADSEDSDQTGRMPRLIWVFAGRTLILLFLSCRGSQLPVHLNHVTFLSKICIKQTKDLCILCINAYDARVKILVCSEEIK